MQKNKYSIIMTTYNREHVIGHAIESVLSQTYHDFEFLIIDNGCTDRTFDVVSSFKDNRIEYIKNPQPSNSCDAPRNLGIQKSKGKYIAFIDDDDAWYPKKLEVVNEAFQKHKEVSVVCHQETIIKNNVVIRKSSYGPWTEDFYERLLYDGNCLSPAAMVIDKKVFDVLGRFDVREDFDAASDYDMWLRIAKKNYRFYFINEILGEFAITGDNKSISNPDFDQKIINIVLFHLKAYEKREYCFSRKGAMRLLKLHYVMSKSYIQCGRWREALTSMFKMPHYFSETVCGKHQ